MATPDEYDYNAGSCGELSGPDILKWNLHARPLPLPDYYTPSGGAPLANIPDDVLLSVPPHLIVHAQRTAAQGGFQVISPRQVPFSSLMLRTGAERRIVGDHVVGSIAGATDVWPTLDDDDLERLLPDEPLVPRAASKVSRQKTRSAPLTKATHEMVDPILACLVKGRAVIDLLRRDDVLGGADEFSGVLANAWGIAREDIEDMDAFTLGIDGPLLRHAIKADEVYSTMYAPIHVRKCVSVGVSDVNRSYLPGDSAMDWRRMRVHAEAVFALTCMVEGHPIKYMACSPPPGNPSAPSNRPNVLCFQPAPGSAWCFEAYTFSILPVETANTGRASAIPADVLRALARHTEVVRPMSYALMKGHRAITRRTTVEHLTPPAKETITAGYMLMVRELSAACGRGKNSARAIRNVIFTTLENADLHTRLRIARYVSIAKSELREHLGITEVPDRMIRSLADRFLEIGDTIRVKIAAESSLRGSSPEEWWADALAQAPDRYGAFVEGTKGWANVAMWLFFAEPTEKWASLNRAITKSALRDATIASLGGVALPVAENSPERIKTALKFVVEGITRAYGGFYKGVSDVGLAIADEADSLNKPRTADMLREASYMWTMRARAFRGTNVDMIRKDEEIRSPKHVRIPAVPMDAVLIPAPYRAFTAYKGHVLKSKILHANYRSHIARVRPVQISDVFKNWKEPLYPVKKTVLTRYLNEPSEMYRDMEAAWVELAADLESVVRIYEPKKDKGQANSGPKRQKVIASVPIEVPEYTPVAGSMSYWSILAAMDEDEVDWVEDLLTRLGQSYEDAVIERDFPSVEAFRLEMQELDRANPRPEEKKKELVR